MFQWMKALVVKPEDPNFIFETNVVEGETSAMYLLTFMHMIYHNMSTYPQYINVKRIINGYELVPHNLLSFN